MIDVKLPNTRPKPLLPAVHYRWTFTHYNHFASFCACAFPTAIFAGGFCGHCGHNGTSSETRTEANLKTSKAKADATACYSKGVPVPLFHSRKKKKEKTYPASTQSRGLDPVSTYHQGKYSSCYETKSRDSSAVATAILITN